jgi:cell division protein ZapA (FtsZ GTPase activity inhibitor)
MASKTQSVEIKLMGQKIALKTSESDPELVRDVAELVSVRIRNAEKRSKSGAAPHQVMVLALMDLAEEYIKAKQRTLDYKRRVGAKSEALDDFIQSELK